jgi:hypothetical protein
VKGVDFRKLDLKLGLAYSALIFALFTVGLVAANATVAGLHPEDYDAFWQPKIIALKAFFADGYMVVFVAWVTNISGLAIIYAKKKAEEYPDMIYNAWKFYGTLAMVIGVGVTALSTLPEPYGKVALILSAVGKIVETSFSKVLPEAAESSEKIEATDAGPPTSTA